MTHFGDVVKNIIIGQAEQGNYYNRIFVVSAYSNVTNWLLEHKKTGEPGVYDLFVKGQGFEEALDELVEDGESVLVMFSGAAPYPINIVKNSEAKEVYGIEINPIAHKYAKLNLELNKINNVSFLISASHQLTK